MLRKLATRAASHGGRLLFGLLVCLTQAAANPGDPCLHDSLTVRGVIRDSKGSPVSGGEVRWWGMVSRPDCRGSGSQHGRTTIGHDGRYRLKVPAGRAYLSIETTDSYGATAEVVLSDTLLDRDLTIDYQLRIYEVNGVVVGPGGQPLDQGNVRYYPDPGRRVLMDNVGLPVGPIQNGRFKVLVRKIGPYRFHTWSTKASDGIASVWTTIPITRDTTITISLEGRAVSGRVLDRDGVGLARASIFARSARAGCDVVTDSSGSYRMHLPPGTYSWSIRPVENWIQTRSFESDSIFDDRIRDFTYSGIAWDGTVVDDETGALLDSIDVWVYQRGPDASTTNAASFLTSKNGAFRVVIEPGWRYSIVASDRRCSYQHFSPRGPDLTLEEIETAFAKVRRRTIDGVVAGTDSTLVIRMTPVQR